MSAHTDCRFHIFDFPITYPSAAARQGHESLLYVIYIECRRVEERHAALLPEESYLVSNSTKLEGARCNNNNGGDVIVCGRRPSAIAVGRMKIRVAGRRKCTARTMSTKTAHKKHRLRRVCFVHTVIVYAATNVCDYIVQGREVPKQNMLR